MPLMDGHRALLSAVPAGLLLCGMPAETVAAAEDPFVASVVACEAKTFDEIGAAMTALGAEAMGDRDRDRIRIGIAKGLAMGAYLPTRNGAAPVPPEDLPPLPAIAGWRLADGDRTIEVTAADFGPAAPGHACEAAIDDDRADAAVRRLTADRGAPEPRIPLKDGAVTVWPSGLPVATYVLTVTHPSRTLTSVSVFTPQLPP